MEIKYLKYREIDKEKWDKCIHESRFPIVYAMSWYLDVVANSKWDALVVGDYEMVFPLPYRRNILGFKEIIHPMFSQQLGLFSKNEIDDSIISECLNHIPKKFKRVILKLNESNSLKSHQKYKMRKRTNILLDLNYPYDTLKSNYSKNLKRNLKKASNNNLSISKDIDVKTAYDFYFTHRGNQLNLSRKVKTNLFNLMTALVDRQYGKISGIFDGKQLLAMIFFIEFNNRMIYLIPPSAPEGKKKFAMHLLLDKIICENANQKKILDFEGSNTEGIARFYRSFGGKEVVYEIVES